MQNGLPSRRMNHQRLQKVHLMKTAVAPLLLTAQQRYRHNFDNKIRRELSFKVGNCVLVDLSAQAAVALYAGVKMENRR